MRAGEVRAGRTGRGQVLQHLGRELEDLVKVVRGVRHLGRRAQSESESEELSQ